MTALRETLEICEFCKKTPLSYCYSLISENAVTYPTFQCDHCYSAFLLPKPCDQTLQHSYAQEYYGDEKLKFSGLLGFLFSLARIWQVRFLPKVSDDYRKLLDIGAGDGTFAKTAASLGFEVYANELQGVAASRLLRHKELEVEIGPFHNQIFAGVEFNLITLWHVFEHLPSAELLSQITSRISPNGMLFIAVPNIESWQAKLFQRNWFHWDPPRHVFLPTKEGISILLEEQGLFLKDSYNFFFQYNVFGWQQSFLNALGLKRDSLFSRLKATRVKGNIILQLVIYSYMLLSLIPATVLAIAESMVGKGGTVLWIFQRR